MQKQILFWALCLASLSLKADYHYVLSWKMPQHHIYHVTLEIEANPAEFTDLYMATWRPGRYIRQDYAAAVGDISITDKNGKPLKWEKPNSSCWRVYASKGEKLHVEYDYFANNDDAGSSYLTEHQAYFNPINLFMFIPNRMNEKVELELPDLSRKWEAATALRTTKSHHRFTAESYHEFADSPTVFADNIKTLTFEIGKTKFYAHFQGEYLGGKEVDDFIVENLKKICAEQGAIFGGFPFEDYHFIYRLLNKEMRHAVEHSNSASFVLPTSVTQSVSAAMSGIMNISSHEFWHLWNVKRIRPASLFPYEYTNPQTTGLHWFTEGITEYYAGLIMTRAGLTPQNNFLDGIAINIQQIENSYAYTHTSATRSSCDSWLYTSDYLNYMYAVSYYTIGERLGTIIDLKMRTMTNNKQSLDDVFRYLYKNYWEQNKGVPEDGIQKAVEALTNESWQPFFDAYIHKNQPFDYAALFNEVGLKMLVTEGKLQGLNKLGVLNANNSSDGIEITRLHPEGDAYLCGLATDDEIVGINGESLKEANLNEKVQNLKKGDSLKFDVMRNGEKKKVKVVYSEKLKIRNFMLERPTTIDPSKAAILEDWLKSKVK